MKPGGYDGEGHDSILDKQSLSADESAEETNDDDDKGTYCAPPGYKEGWVVVHARPRVRRCVGGGEYGIHDVGRGELEGAAGRNGL